MKTQDFLETLQLCQKRGIKTLSELKQFKINHNIRTSKELLIYLER